MCIEDSNGNENGTNKLSIQHKYSVYWHRVGMHMQKEHKIINNNTYPKPKRNLFDHVGCAVDFPKHIIQSTFIIKYNGIFFYVYPKQK